ncbi:periplasmic binding protein-like I [Hesseltinella vesiculosa]|uniref:Periplasmic binding protein-like I n=1 Tax=Hesseltinella vesiculosa TaxID=101127 RepID=A0A1X2GWA2_9FUNG|nr:periplasmic binding protein-like I [Hesseltinella vesiculosa]
MAIETINQQQLIPGAYITLIPKDSYPNTEISEKAAVTNAVFASGTLLQKQQVQGVIGDISSSWTSLSALISSTLQVPQCSFASTAIALSDKSSYDYFFRTIPTQVIFADVMVSFAALQGWSKIGVIYEDTTFGQQYFQRAILQAGLHGMDIVQSQAFGPDLEKDALTFAIQNVTQSMARVILVAGPEEGQSVVMTQAAALGYLSDDYTWLLLGRVDAFLRRDIRQYNHNHTSSPVHFNTTFNGIFMFDYWLSLSGYAPFDSFIQQWSKLDPQMLAYSCMMVMAEGFNRVLGLLPNRTQALKSLVNNELREYLIPDAFNTGYVGPNGPMVFDTNGDLLQR